MNVKLINTISGYARRGKSSAMSFQPLAIRLESPAIGFQSPVLEGESPAIRPKSPGTGFQSLAPEGESTALGTEYPVIRLQSLEIGIKNGKNRAKCLY
jgi:hypothetical protein